MHCAAGEEEVPPIPCHVHSGDVVGGRCVGHGKTEAYFFPPLNVPPYNLELDAVKTRLGLRPGTTKDQVLKFQYCTLKSLRLQGLEPGDEAMILQCHDILLLWCQ